LRKTGENEPVRAKRKDFILTEGLSTENKMKAGSAMTNQKEILSGRVPSPLFVINFFVILK